MVSLINHLGGYPDERRVQKSFEYRIPARLKTCRDKLLRDDASDGILTFRESIKFGSLGMGSWHLKGVPEMRNGIAVVLFFAFFFFPWMTQAQTQETKPAQKKIMMERGEKVTGNRLELVKKVIESYRDCEVLAKGNELTGLKINGKLYSDFTLVVRDAKRTIIVATPDGVVSFDY